MLPITSPKPTLQKKDRYEALYENFKWKVPEYYNFGFDVVDQWAEDRTKQLQEHVKKATTPISIHV